MTLTCEQMISESTMIFKEETQRKNVAELLKDPLTDEQKEFIRICLAFREIEKFQPEYYDALKISLYSSLIEGIGYRICKSNATENYCCFFKKLLDTKSKITFLSTWREKYELRLLGKKPKYLENITAGVLQILEGNVKCTSPSRHLPICWKESCHFEAGKCYFQKCRLKTNEKELNEFVSLLARRYYDYYRSKFTHKFKPENTFEHTVKDVDGSNLPYTSIDSYEEYETENKISFINDLDIPKMEDMIRTGLFEYLKEISKR